jgi:beta-N-acetylhexosaminidase
MALGPVMLDIEGLELTPADRLLLREQAVGGVILFSRNYASPEQLSDLVSAIRAVRSPPILVAVDHEGGRVQRFRKGFSAIPPMRRLGLEFDRDQDAAVESARMAGWLIASELRAAAIDLVSPCTIRSHASEGSATGPFTRSQLSQPRRCILRISLAGTAVGDFPGHGWYRTP